MKKFRNLYANEIDCRPQQIDKNGKWCSLLLYKDARVDMNLLDEVYGSGNWQRTHEVINGQLFCNIDIWDDEKKCWVRKQDVGTESNMDAEKGRASDAMKRACFNVGIGRELYTAPHIFISLDQNETSSDRSGNKKLSKLSFSVKEVGYNNSNEINKLVIIDNKGKVRYSLGSDEKVIEPETQPKTPELDNNLSDILVNIKLTNTVTELERIWNECYIYQCNRDFKSAILKRKKELT